MYGNLSQPSHRDVIERPLPFEPREATFHGCPLTKEGLPRDWILPDTTLEHQLGVCSVHLNDRFRSVLPLYQGEQWLAGIASVGHHVLGMELAGSDPGFPEHMGGSSYVAGIPRRYVGGYGKLSLTIH
jgi:hypothetical protein